jgi:hypothetical protein
MLTPDALSVRLNQAFLAAARQLRREPVSAILIVSTMTIGIAAAAAIFTVAPGVLLRPLPYRDASSLIAIQEFQPAIRKDASTVAFGVQPLIGRGIEPSDVGDNPARIALIGYGLWAGRFGADRSLVGKSITIDGQPGELHAIPTRPRRGRDSRAGALETLIKVRPVMSSAD